MKQAATQELEFAQEVGNAEDFIKLYYEKLSKEQYQQLSRLFLDDALLVWNGNGAKGVDEIQKLLSTQTPRIYNTMSLDVQKLPDNNITKDTYALLVGGTLSIGGKETDRYFQHFMTTSANNRYKIIFSSFRDTLNSI